MLRGGRGGRAVAAAEANSGAGIDDTGCYSRAVNAGADAPGGPASVSAAASAASDASIAADLRERIGAAIDASGGWLPFSRFMAMALYEPGLGYYASGRRVFGAMPQSGSDFVTAPELSPLFGRALAVQVGEALARFRSDEIVEFGAGTGALAAQLLAALDAAGQPVRRYSVVELSAPLRERQRESTRAFGDRVRWLDAWPDAIGGVAIGNEVLDAIPVDVVRFDGATWHEHGVARSGEGGFAWADGAPTTPPADAMFPAGAVIEVHPQAEAFVASLAERLRDGAAFFIDYGFPADELYHPQRAAGTIACHRGHRVDYAPLDDAGEKDITAHVDFTGVALAAQGAGLSVAGYTSQARFLLNCGIGKLLASAPLAGRVAGQRLVHEHEMGELFKVIAFSTDAAYEPLGFVAGDRRHRL